MGISADKSTTSRQSYNLISSKNAPENRDKSLACGTTQLGLTNAPNGRQ